MDKGKLINFHNRESNSVRIQNGFRLPSEKGSTLKGKNLLHVGANSFHLKLAPFQRDLVCKKAYRNSQNLTL